MLKTISKPVMIALTLMLMSLSPMVGNASAHGESFDLVESQYGIMNDGDVLSVPSGFGLDFEVQMHGLVIDDTYILDFNLYDGNGTLIYEAWNDEDPTTTDMNKGYYSGILADDCGYSVTFSLHHVESGGSTALVGEIMFNIDVGECLDILAEFEDATIDEETTIILVPDHEPGEEEQADIFVMSDMKIDSSFRDLLDSDGDGDVTEYELYGSSGLHQALHDDRYPDSGINWTLDGVAGISEGEDVQLHFDLEELLGPITNATYIADNAWVQSYLMFNITGLGGLENESTQTLEFDDIENDGMLKVQEHGRDLVVTNVTLNGTGAYYMQEYSTNADSTFECSSVIGGEIDMDIDFYKVNDGTEDCGDGSDEPQDFDGDGITDNWFDCHNANSNTTVSMDVVNDGNWDCNDGEDEGMEYVPASWEIPHDEGTLVLELGAIQMQDIDIFMESVITEEIRFLPLDELLVDVVFAFDGDVRAEFDDNDDGFVTSQELNELWSQLEEGMNGDDEPGDDKANFTLDGVFHSVDVHFTPDLYQLMGPTDAGDGEVILTFNVITLDTSNDHFIAIDDMEFDGMLCIENTEYFTVGSATWDGVGMGYDSDLESTCYEDEGMNGTLEFDLVATHDGGEDNAIDKVDLGFELYNSAASGIIVEFEITLVSWDGEHASSLRMDADEKSNGDGMVDGLEADMYYQEFNLLEDHRTFECSSVVGGEPDMEIDFSKVNDGTEDCGDGSDEPQDMDPTNDSDGDGIDDNDHDSWFDCNDKDGSTVNMDVVNDGVDDCPNGEDENWDDEFFFFDDVPFNNDYTSITYSGIGLEGDVNQTGDVMITVVYTYEFADADTEVGHYLVIDICCEGGDDNGDQHDDPPTPEEAMNETDANGDGNMSYEEFETEWNSTDENSTEEDNDAELDWDKVADLFDDCDLDANDLIDIDEMECFINGIEDMLGEGNGMSDGDDGPPTPEEAMNETDANGDGNMSYEEFETEWNSTDENSTEEDNDAELDWDKVADLFDDCDLDANDLIDIDEMECFINGIEDMLGEGNGMSDGIEWHMELFSTADWNLINIARDDGLVEDTDTGYYSAPFNGDDFYISAYFEPSGMACPPGQHEDAATGDCVDDAAGPEDCEGSDIWDADSQSCIPDPAMSCAADEIWDYVLEACVDDTIDDFVDCAGVVNGTSYVDAAGVCVEEDTTIGPEDCMGSDIWDADSQSCIQDPSMSCAAGENWDYTLEACVVETPLICDPDEILDPLTNTCVDDPTVADPVDTAPNCEVFYWVGSTGNPTNNWNWTEMMEGWTEFTAPNNGEYTLALPKGDYFVYFGCWDAEGDDITLAVDGLPEIQEFESEKSWVWGWDEFSINEEDVGMQHDMVIAWSSTDFGGNVTIHFTGVDGLADSVADSETGGLPGFTASLGLMAMLGAALILARRKD